MRPEETKRLGVGIYGPSEAHISKVIVAPGSRSHPIDILQAAFFDSAMSERENWKEFGDDGDIGQLSYHEHTTEECGFGYFFIRNFSTSTTMKVNLYTHKTELVDVRKLFVLLIVVSSIPSA